MARLELTGLTKRFSGDVTAIRDLSLTVDDELLVLLGPSGSGKSTTLRLIAGLETPDDGRVCIDDQVVNNLPPARRGVSLVFQELALYPHLTVKKNLSFGLELKGGMNGLSRLGLTWLKARLTGSSAAKTRWAEIDDEVTKVARMLSIEGLLARRPDELSGGERQRVALGRALVGRPRVLLLDEPLAHLDVRLRETARRELVDLRRRLGACMLYVTHDQAEALALGDRIGVLDAGRLRQLGTPQEVYDAPADRFVAGFLGSPPMNLLDGELSGGEGTALCFRGAGFCLPLAGAPVPVASQRRFTLGIRPEAIEVRGSQVGEGREQHEPLVGEGCSTRCAAALDARHWLGDTIVAYVLLGAARLAVKCGTRTPSGRSIQNATAPDPISCNIPHDEMHWFDAQSGRRVTRLERLEGCNEIATN
ncbi:MAG: ABC transporter ATP-binding protein [Planctomycetia bacterium]|nr:ABC transporter ATP-binding protein [Planctomycetia bacterium]